MGRARGQKMNDRRRYEKQSACRGGEDLHPPQLKQPRAAIGFARSFCYMIRGAASHGAYERSGDEWTRYKGAYEQRTERDGEVRESMRTKEPARVKADEGRGTERTSFRRWVDT